MLPLFTIYPPVTHLPQSDVYLTLHNSQRAKMVLISLSHTRCVNVPLAICQTCPQGKLLARLSVVPVHLSAFEAQNVRQRANFSFLKAALRNLHSDIDKSSLTAGHNTMASIFHSQNSTTRYTTSRHTTQYTTLHTLHHTILYYMNYWGITQNATRVEELSNAQIIYVGKRKNITWNTKDVDGRIILS